jgi:hypothetical protein
MAYLNKQKYKKKKFLLRSEHTTTLHEADKLLISGAFSIYFPNLPKQSMNVSVTSHNGVTAVINKRLSGFAGCVRLLWIIWAHSEKR